MTLGACGWPQFRGDGLRSGVAALEHDVSASRLADLQIAWSSYGRNFATEPIVRGGVVIVAGSFSIYGLDARTGAERWRRTELVEPHTYSDLSQPTTGPGPTAAGTVYVTNYWSQQDIPHGPYRFGETTYALDGATGATIRTYAAGNHRPPVVAGDGWLYLGDLDAFRVEAFGPDGEHFTVPTPASTQDLIADGVAVRVSAGTAIFSFAPHGCGQATCMPFRSDQLHPVFASDPTTIAENGTTIFAIGINRLYAFPRAGCGAATCRARWTYDDVYLSGATLAVTGDAVFAVTGDAIRVLDARRLRRADLHPGVELGRAPGHDDSRRRQRPPVRRDRRWRAPGLGRRRLRGTDVRADLVEPPGRGDLARRRRRRGVLPHPVAERPRRAEARRGGSCADVIAPDGQRRALPWAR